jgi:excisionase family DNA binding protein
MKTLHVDPKAGEPMAPVAAEVERLLAEGKSVTVTVAEERELLSPQQVSARLGFSRQHVVRLINAGEIEAERMAGSSYWQIPLSAVLAFEERMAEADRLAGEWSRSLDELGAPLE